jgi:hypothetical protein
VKKLAVALLVASTLVGAHAHAGTVTGNDYAKMCSGPNPKLTDLTYCVTYARGLADGFGLWRDLDKPNAPMCIPDAVTGMQLTDVTLKYIREHPEKRHLGVPFIMTDAFFDAWPCDKERD